MRLQADMMGGISGLPIASASHVSARPRAYKQDADAIAAFKKTSEPVWRKSVTALRQKRR
jgi:hypothetical protein